MKKLISYILLISLLLCLVPSVNAAGYGSVSGPSTVRAGDTITISYNAGGGIYGGSGSVSYDSSLLTLNNYSAAIGGNWAVEFSGNNFVFYDNSMANPISGATIFTASFTVKANVAAGTTVSVSVSGTVSDGQNDSGAGGSWSVAIAPPLSKNCDLSTLTVSGASISPAFNAATTSYSASVPFSTSSLQVSATAADSKAKVSINNPQLTAGSTTTISVTVTAESGATKTYSIKVAREQDPNYVPSSVKTLESLTVEGQTLSPVFDPATTQYYIWLPYETEAVSISGTATDSKASVSVGQIPTLEPGKAVAIPVTVTAEDETQQVYTVTVFRAPAHADTEKFLQGDRPQEPEVTEPTEPQPEPAPIVEDKATPQWVLPTIIGVAALLVGIGAGFGICLAIRKKKETTAE